VVALVKERTFSILDVVQDGDVTSRFVDALIATLIIANVIVILLETVPSLAAKHGPYFQAFDLFTVVAFTIEYGLRLWSCTYSPQYAHPIWGRVRFAQRPMIVIDLIAILPFFLPMLLPMDMRMIRILRLVRLLRVFKLARYSRALQMMGRVLMSKKEELVVGFVVMLILLVFASSLMYVVEHAEQPEAFGSIPSSMWWAVSTLTTVGYGDVYPITSVGRILGALIAMMGVGMFAMPAGIIAQGFSEQHRRKRGWRPPMRCPHCNEIVHRRRDTRPETGWGVLCRKPLMFGT